MPTNEDGEFELILGNRQLLSVFFIVVVLLGVFFTMGWVVGVNSKPVGVTDASARKADTKPLVVDSAAPHESAPVESSAERSSTSPGESSSPAPVTTAPQQPAESPKAAKSEPAKTSPAKSEPAKSEPVKSAKAERIEKEKAEKAERAARSAPASASSGAPSGTYLQLAATTKREADIMVDVLRQKRFAAMTAEVPEKAGLFRVLVGPVSESQVNKTKTDLQSAGFPGDKSIKRNY